MKTERFNSQRGASIIEILIVLVVVAILSTAAIMQLGSSRTDLQRQRIAREFKVYLERARFDSVKRRAVNVNDMAKITLGNEASNNATSFSAALDFNGDGKLLASETREVDFTQRSQTQIIVNDTLNYPVTIRFDQRGHITATDNSTPAKDVTPVFTICSGNCSATSPDATVISISPTGTVAVLKTAPGASPLPTPSISNTTPLLNCYVLLTNANPPQCTNK